MFFFLHLQILCFLILTSHACLFFLWFLRAQKPLRQMKGWALVFPPLPLPCPASGLPVRGGDWDAVDDAAAGSSFALITPREPTVVWFGFLQPGLIFHISDVNALSNPPPYTFDQICTICLWREMNRLAGVLLFNSPSRRKWFDQAAALMGASSPILRQYYVLKIAWLEIMKAYDFLEQRSHPERRGDRDLTEDVLTRPLLPNQLPEVELDRYRHQRKVHIYLITSSLMSVLLHFPLLSHWCSQ